jgi:hypothetical protein
MTTPPPWWQEAYVDTARELEGDPRYRPRSEKADAYEGPIWRFVQDRAGATFYRSLSVLDAGTRPVFKTLATVSEITSRFAIAGISIQDLTTDPASVEG